MMSVKRGPFCLGLNALISYIASRISSILIINHHFNIPLNHHVYPEPKIPDMSIDLLHGRSRQCLPNYGADYSNDPISVNGADTEVKTYIQLKWLTPGIWCQWVSKIVRSKQSIK